MPKGYNKNGEKLGFQKDNIPWNKGKQRNVTWGANLSKALKGKKKSMEHRRKLSLSKRGKKNHFWKGGVTSAYLQRLSGIEWDEKRKARLKMDGYRCQICGKFTKLEVHHIIPWRISHDDSLENLMSVCRPCHLYLDRGWRNE